MNIIKIQGGLGNQLFQYSFGLFLEKKTGLPSLYDIEVKRNDKNFTNRSLDIEKFGFSLKQASKKEISKRKLFPSNFWRIERKLSLLFPFINKNFFVQNKPHTDIEISYNGYYDGYWQRLDIVEEVEDILLEKIKLIDSQKIKFEELLFELNKHESISIHIRRDDYINIPANAKIFEVCDRDYYENAIRYFKKKFPNAKFYIFTQDKQWALENFTGEEFQFISGNSAIEDMLLMAHCKHNIVANSTFSWWSAFLNRNEEKTVIAPKSWYKNTSNLSTENFIKQNWIRI